MRWFSYKPLEDLQFEHGKSLIMQNNSNDKLFMLGNFAVLGAPGLMAYRIVANYSLMGTFNFLFSSALLVGTSFFTKAWLGFTSSFVKEIHLVKSGKHIEITNYGIYNTKIKIKISDILNPEESLQTKVKMQFFGTWVIETRQGDCFYVVQESQAYHKDVLKHILKGIEIEVAPQKDKSDIIDI